MSSLYKIYTKFFSKRKTKRWSMIVFYNINANFVHQAMTTKQILYVVIVKNTFVNHTQVIFVQIVSIYKKCFSLFFNGYIIYFFVIFFEFLVIKILTVRFVFISSQI